MRRTGKLAADGFRLWSKGTKNTKKGRNAFAVLVLFVVECRFQIAGYNCVGFYRIKNLRIDMNRVVVRSRFGTDGVLILLTHNTCGVSQDRSQKIAARARGNRNQRGDLTTTSSDWQPSGAAWTPRCGTWCLDASA